MKSWLTWTNIKSTFWGLAAIGALIAFVNLAAALPVWIGAILFFGLFYVVNGGPEGGVRGGDHGGPDG
ncbi:hypothetical protein ACSQ76_22070 [Roseovarius sp. B08]|uniref:hypothetical protein n=1 Tax=Roseovarius sp. B08 TaxID=3449223 RepID=UPI003EDCAF99